MKNFILFFLVSFILSACTKTDKSMFNSPCADSCAIVQGRFITGSNEGVANVPIEIKSEVRATLGLGVTTIRKIASGKTDNNGFYSLKFGLTEREYGQTSIARVSISFNYDKSKFVPVTWYENFGANEFIGPFRRKDTTINADIYFTSRSKLKVRLENFAPIQSGDNFSVITSCGAGLDRHYTSVDFVDADQNITEKEIDACGNEQTSVIIRKRKNGVSSSSSTTISTPTGQTVAVTFTY